MKKITGRDRRPTDDEWYTPRETADKVAEFLKIRLPLDTPILCPADLLPDGSESTIPQALRAAGFVTVRVTRNLPINSQITDDWEHGEVIVTNPPFSLLTQFREFYLANQAKFCVLSKPGTLRLSWSIPEMGDKFKSTDGRRVAACWCQNIVDTTKVDNSKAIGNCSLCERKFCPNNEMTGKLNPGANRPLFGYGHATKMGLAGWYCSEYTINGKKSFTRYMEEPK